MSALGTLVIYVILGLVVAAATALRDERPAGLRLAFLFTAGVLFWPFLAPSLLGGAALSPTSASPGAADGPLALRIQAAEDQVLAALGKVKGGVAEGALAPEAARVRHLAGSLRALATRLGDIDETLRAPELDAQKLEERLADLTARGCAEGDARAASLRARLRNVERLRALRARTHDDLERALFKMEEITSQMLLLKFAGRPDAEVAGLIDEIAEGVEGVAEALFAVG
jgi:hypothetical protein